MRQLTLPGLILLAIFAYFFAGPIMKIVSTIL